MNCVSFRALLFSFFFFFNISFSASPAQSSTNQDKRDDIFNDVYSSINKIYCKNSKQCKVKIYIDDFSCPNCNDEKEFILNKFLKNHLIGKFRNTAHCVKLVSESDLDRNFTISGGIYDRSYLNKDYPITVSISVEKTLTNTVFFGERYNFNADNFNQKEYEKYKHRYSNAVIDKTTKPVITIKAVNQGEAYKEEDKYFLKTIYGFGWIDQQIFKKDTGFSGYYPANQQIVLNGNVFKLGAENEFFHGIIEPGAYEIIAKFNETFWDASDRHQHIQKERNKKFKILVTPDDNLEIKIYFIYDGEISDIQIQAFRKKEIEVGRSIRERKEVIEVYY